MLEGIRRSLMDFWYAYTIAVVVVGWIIIHSLTSVPEQLHLIYSDSGTNQRAELDLNRGTGTLTWKHGDEHLGWHVKLVKNNGRDFTLRVTPDTDNIQYNWSTNKPVDVSFDPVDASNQWSCRRCGQYLFNGIMPIFVKPQP